MFSAADASGGLKLKPDVFPNENDPAEKLPEAPPPLCSSGFPNVKTVLPELSVLVAAVFVGLVDTVVLVAGSLKLKPKTEKNHLQLKKHAHK